jgi:hypothetical protein
MEIKIKIGQKNIRKILWYQKSWTQFSRSPVASLVQTDEQMDRQTQIQRT